jgi:hypothetical protein
MTTSKGRYLGMTGALLLGIALTGFDRVHWLFYPLVGWPTFAAVAGRPGAAGRLAQHPS